MRYTAVARGRIGRQDAAKVSLFPFLAVLICTMGALILLLVVIARQARLQAAENTATNTATVEAADTELAAELEMVRWRISELQKSREKTESQLAQSRLQLGHIEDHARRLRRELAQLEAAWAKLGKFQSDGGRRREELQAELARLKSEITEAQRRLAEAQLAAERRRKSYAVVPYEGPNKTHRRPIYIECRADSVVLQPEGIVLTEADFDGPLGPGNPLAAALRAIREYLNEPKKGPGLICAKHLPGRSGKLNLVPFSAPRKQGEPYPLLLVRPEGISAYTAARTAMKSWGSEFGYELIEEGWDLEFQPRDPELARVVQQAVDTARVRQQRLAAAAPRSYGQRSRAFYTVSPHHGGVVRYGGGGEFDESPSRSRRSRGGFGKGFGSGAGKDFGSGAGKGFGNGAGDGLGSSSAGRSGLSGTGRPGSPGGTGSHAGEPGNRIAGNDFTAAATANVRTGGAGGTGQAGQPGMEPSGGGQTGSGQSSSGQSSAGQSSSGQSSSGQAGSPGGPNLSVNLGQPGRTKPRKLNSLALTRGRDWGLPDSGSRSVPITRPIRVDCHQHRLVIVPERGLGDGKVIPLAPRTEQSVDELVSAVWEQMDRWGIAGRGMYWRPILSFYVAPGAENRHAELSDLLEGSGLKVQRKE